jgi:hypothetical protein
MVKVVADGYYDHGHRSINENHIPPGRFQMRECDCQTGT